MSGASSGVTSGQVGLHAAPRRRAALLAVGALTLVAAAGCATGFAASEGVPGAPVGGRGASERVVCGDGTLSFARQPTSACWGHGGVTVTGVAVASR